MWRIITVCSYRFVNLRHVHFVKAHLPEQKLYFAVCYRRCNRQSCINVFVYSLMLMSFRELKFSETPNKQNIKSIYILSS